MTKRSNNSVPVSLSAPTPEVSGSSIEYFAVAENRDEFSGHARVAGQIWITDELIEDTRQVWSKRYGRVIAQEEAVEILVNVKKVAEAFLKAARRPAQ